MLPISRVDFSTCMRYYLSGFKKQGGISRMQKASATSSNIDKKTVKTLGYVLLGHIATIGVLYFGAMNLIVK